MRDVGAAVEAAGVECQVTEGSQCSGCGTGPEWELSS